MALTPPNQMVALHFDNFSEVAAMGKAASVTLTASALTEGGTDLGGTADGDITALSLAWDGSTFPIADEGAALVDGIRECAAMINALAVDVAAIKSALVAAGLMSS